MPVVPHGGHTPHTARRRASVWVIGLGDVRRLLVPRAGRRTRSLTPTRVGSQALTSSEPLVCRRRTIHWDANALGAAQRRWIFHKVWGSAVSCPNCPLAYQHTPMRLSPPAAQSPVDVALGVAAGSTSMGNDQSRPGGDAGGGASAGRAPSSSPHKAQRMGGTAGAAGKAGACPWSDCSCGAGCKCGAACKCGKVRR